MAMNKFMTVTVISLFFVFGCSMLKDYGKLRIESGKEGINVQSLVEDWKDYSVYYAGLSAGNPSAVMFDPEDDDNKLVPDKWVFVEDKKRVSEVVHRLNADIENPPKLWRIMGPDNNLYGYMYTAWDHVLIRLYETGCSRVCYIYITDPNK